MLKHRMLKHTKRQVNEFCLQHACVLLSCLSPWFAFYSLLSKVSQESKAPQVSKGTTYLSIYELNCNSLTSLTTIKHRRTDKTASLLKPCIALR